jgi:MFS family permease
MTFAILVKITPQAAVVPHQVDGVRTSIPRAAWVLGIMALAFGLSEGTAVDWSSLRVTDVARVDPTTGSLGLVAVSALMTVIRLLGDRLVSRFGRRAVVRSGGAYAALGYLMVTLVSSLPLLVVGWALVGFGVGMIAPRCTQSPGTSAAAGCWPWWSPSGTPPSCSVRRWWASWSSSWASTAR